MRASSRAHMRNHVARTMWRAAAAAVSARGQALPRTHPREGCAAEGVLDARCDLLLAAVALLRRRVKAAPVNQCGSASSSVRGGSGRSGGGGERRLEGHRSAAAGASHQARHNPILLTPP